MSDVLVQALANNIASRLEAAREQLVAEMHALGLTAEAGWRVVEELRHTIDGTEWIFKPMHIREAPPAELRSTVLIDHEGRPASPA
jgi:hypothetical protein